MFDLSSILGLITLAGMVSYAPAMIFFIRRAEARVVRAEAAAEAARAQIADAIADAGRSTVIGIGELMEAWAQHSAASVMSTLGQNAAKTKEAESTAAQVSMLGALDGLLGEGNGELVLNSMNQTAIGRKALKVAVGMAEAGSLEDAVRMLSPWINRIMGGLSLKAREPDQQKRFSPY